jgi:hypothetical protein
MKKFTLLFVVWCFAILNVSAQDAVNSVSFLGETPKIAVGGGKVILNVEVKAVDAQPAVLMIGLVKIDENYNILGSGPITFELTFLTGTAPYSLQVSDTISIPADLALSSSLGEGEKYAYFTSVLSSAFAPLLTIMSNEVKIVDASVGNSIAFSPAPIANVMPGVDVVVGVDLTAVDDQPGVLMIGMVKVDSSYNILGSGPIFFELTFLSGTAPYSKIVTDSIKVPADLPLSSSLGVGEKYAYFSSVLSMAFAPLKTIMSDVVVKEAANSVAFSPEPEKVVMPADKVLVGVDINAADAQPGVLMIGLAKVDANYNILGAGPINFELTFLSGVAPYSTNVTDSITIPADLPLSSTLGEGEKYAYFTSILSMAFAPLHTAFSDVTVSLTTSIKDNINKGFKLYPNPVTNKLYITGIQENEMIEIYNIAGTKVSQTNFSFSGIDVSGLNSGVYFIKGKSFVSKFIKQ